MVTVFLKHTQYPFNLRGPPSIWNNNSEWRRRIRGGLATLRPHVNHLMGVYIDWMVCKENELQGIISSGVAVSSVDAVFMAQELFSVWGPEFEQISMQEKEAFTLHTSIHLRVFCWLLRISHHTKRELRWRHAVFRMATTSYFMNANVDFVLITKALANVEWINLLWK